MKQESVSVVVAIPVYKQYFSANEEKSFRRSCSIFGEKYPIVAFAPENLDMSKYLDIFPLLQIERFPDHFFRSINDYSRLLLSEEFYERFAAFEWMLICHLDVWVFKDELAYWCGRDIDYWGAPLVATWDPSISESATPDIVGNGGFSLRRISKILEVLRAGDAQMYSQRKLLDFIKNHIKQGNFHKVLIPLCRMAGIGNRRKQLLEKLRSQGASEDMVFITMTDPENPPFLTIPSVDEAAYFALDGGITWRYFNKTQHVPFALHSWYFQEGQELIELVRKKYGPDLTDI